MTTNAGPNPYLREVGRRLKERRRDLGYTQEELARLLGISRSNLANIEAGRQDMGLLKAAPLCRLLGVSFPDLLGY